MAEVVRNSLPYLTDADLRAMAWYLKSIPPDSALRTERHPHAASKRGDDPLYRYCMGCHQSKDRGMPGCYRRWPGAGTLGASDLAG
jgi:hypothetical protein